MSETATADLEEVYVTTSCGKMHLPPEHPQLSRSKCNVPFNVDGRHIPHERLAPFYEYCENCFPERT